MHSNIVQIYDYFSILQNFKRGYRINFDFQSLPAKFVVRGLSITNFVTIFVV